MNKNLDLQKIIISDEIQLDLDACREQALSEFSEQTGQRSSLKFALLAALFISLWFNVGSQKADEYSEMKQVYRELVKINSQKEEVKDKELLK